jgi:hypothetical protein
VLFVRNAISRFECLNKFVMYLASLPVYVKVIYLCIYRTNFSSLSVVIAECNTNSIGCSCISKWTVQDFKWNSR